MGLDDPLGDGHAQTGPLDLGRVEGVEHLESQLGGNPWSVVTNGDADGWPAIELRSRGSNLDRHRRRTCRQGVVQDVAEDLLEAERVRDAAQIHAIDHLAEDSLLAL